MRDLVTAYVALGANLGDAVATVRQAIAAIAAVDGVQLLRQSSLYRTAPVDSSGPDYVNAVVEISTLLTAPDLLTELQRLELRAGRQRPYHNAPRTLDLDILLYGSAIINSPQLVVPHPRMNERAFVQVPLAEIAPELVSAEALKAVSSQPCRVDCAQEPGCPAGAASGSYHALNQRQWKEFGVDATARAHSRAGARGNRKWRGP